VTAQQARPVGFGWFMDGCRSRLSGKLAGRSESRPGSPQSESLDTKLVFFHVLFVSKCTLCSPATMQHGRGRPKRYHRSARPQCWVSCSADCASARYSVTGGAGCTPLGKATAIRLHTHDVVPGSHRRSPPEACSPWDMPSRPGATDIEAILYQAYPCSLLNQDHCTGFSAGMCAEVRPAEGWLARLFISRSSLADVVVAIEERLPMRWRCRTSYKHLRLRHLYFRRTRLLSRPR
jgi:hypothetical protein